MQTAVDTDHRVLACLVVVWISANQTLHTAPTDVQKKPENRTKKRISPGNRQRLAAGAAGHELLEVEQTGDTTPDAMQHLMTRARQRPHTDHP
ncbi:hypothetical protein [Nocardia sp. NPDC051463]|uniref:hypothetical protein n=1 Tax=Nocardia sp. NPDC051463 TaxID=3154845 RepID=UPI003450F91E